MERTQARRTALQMVQYGSVAYFLLHPYGKSKHWYISREQFDNIY